MLSSNVLSPQSLLDSQKSSSSAVIEYPALDSQMSASQNSHFPSSLELFSQNGSSCSAPLPIAHLTNGSLSKPTSDPAGHGQKDKRHYMKYLSAGSILETANTSSTRHSVESTGGGKSTFDSWKAEQNNKQNIAHLKSIVLENNNELMKSISSLQSCVEEASQLQSDKLQSLTTLVDTGFTTIQELFKEVKCEENDLHSLMNTLFNEIGELKKDILKRDKQIEELQKEVVELRSSKFLTETVQKALQLTLKECFTTETLRTAKPPHSTPYNGAQSSMNNNSNQSRKQTQLDYNDCEQNLRAHNIDNGHNLEASSLICDEQVPVVPDIESHQLPNSRTHNTATENNSFVSPCSDWATDFSRSSAQKRKYSQRITISRKISPTVSSPPTVTSNVREYNTWGGDTSSSDHDTIEVTQLASFTRKVRRKPKGKPQNEEGSQNILFTNPESYENNYLSSSEYQKESCGPMKQAVVPAGRFRRSTEAKKRRILCDNNDAELLQISASIRQQQMSRQFK
ncbi:putative leucine-rich repeat-containing protein DDB_G0290503 isoform X2 [Dysidea avara]|uniref:putative leucine-rich repeat-containing protein DDB_G0290503 isoform X2 n=1 Tax=Dysidea avara TaxID=196820 RepID=UPI0033236E3F